MRRINRMRLKDQIGHPVERRVGEQRFDHLVGRPDMNVERRDEIGERSAMEDVTCRDEMIDGPTQAVIGETQRLLPIVGHEKRT